MIGEVDGKIILNNDKWRRVQAYRGQKPDKKLLEEYIKIGGAIMEVEKTPKKATKKTIKKAAKKVTKKK